MEWFKFYNFKWLTDLNVLSLEPLDRLCFITLLCLAASSDERNGSVTQYHEHRILTLTHLSPEEYKKCVGFTKRLADFGLIEEISYTEIRIKNFQKRQNTMLSGAERAKKYRENHKVTNVTQESDERNARVDKNRVDKNITNTEQSSFINLKKNKMDIDYETGEVINEKPKAHKREDVIKLANLFDKMASEYSNKKITTPKSYFIIINAINKHGLKPKGVIKLFEDWFNNPKVKDENKVKLNFALTADNINAFKVLN